MQCIREGNFVEALKLYDKAIFMSPQKAVYRSNRVAMGRWCWSLRRLDPGYGRAHQRVNLHEIGKRWRVGGFDAAALFECGVFIGDCFSTDMPC